MLLALVMSVNVTGDCDCGVDGGGLVAGTVELYDLPVRAGVGEAVGEGCWEHTVGPAASSKRDNNNNIEIFTQRRKAAKKRREGSIQHILQDSSQLRR